MDERLIQRAAAVLEQEFGSDWLTIAQQLGTENLRQRVGKELTSFMAFPERGNGGDNRWRGNCSPEVVVSVLRYVLDTKRYYGKKHLGFCPVRSYVRLRHQQSCGRCIGRTVGTLRLKSCSCSRSWRLECTEK